MTESTITESISLRVGRRLRHYRREAGLTLAQLGQAVGVTGNQIGHLERGYSGFTLEILERLAIALDVKITLFFK